MRKMNDTTMMTTTMVMGIMVRASSRMSFRVHVHGSVDPELDCATECSGNLVPALRVCGEGMASRSRVAAAELLARGPPPEQAAPISDEVRAGGERLRKYLLSQYKEGHLTARQLATTCYWATQGGSFGVADLGLHPDSDHAAEHVRAALEVRSLESFYVVRLPVWDHEQEARTHVDFPMNLPHEQVAASFAEDPRQFDPINFDADTLPPEFSEHSVVRDAPGGRAFPVGFYSDAVPHTRSDSFIAYYLSNGLNGRRSLLCSLRKSDLCKCGCKGFCTLGQVTRALTWSFCALASGLYPATNHENGPLDHSRCVLRGTEICSGWRGALCEVRADLLEITSSLGFRNWQNP
eukprot:393695-Pyramimonas_sp.AAC.1